MRPKEQPQITLTRVTASGFAIETNVHQPTLRYAVAESLRFASLVLAFGDAEAVVVRPGQLAVDIPETNLTVGELDVILYLAARKFAQINSLPLASVTRFIQDES